MQIEIADEVIAGLGLDERTCQEIFAVSLYAMKKINGVQGGKLLGIPEIEFHGLLEKYGTHMQYDVQDLHDDVETLKGLRRETDRPIS